MKNNTALTFEEMCRREGLYFQRGMTFRAPSGRAVLLLGKGAKAVYQDCWGDRSGVLVYEGHNAMRSRAVPLPQSVDQPLQTASGAPTQNGLFMQAAQDYRNGTAAARPVRIYKKARKSLWLDLGEFALIDAWREFDGRRLVCRFKLRRFLFAGSDAPPARRGISASVKVRVWNRDGGRCAVCGETKNLHFDHILPLSRGGSNTEDNIQILCEKHNLLKSDNF